MLHVLFGPDTFSRREALQKLKAELDADGMLQTNTIVFDARQTTPQEVIGACDTAPFLSSHRLVVVEGALQQASQGPRGRSRRPPKADQAGEGGSPPGRAGWLALANYVQRMPPTTTLVLLDGDVSPDAPLLKALRGKGQIRHFRPPDQRDVAGWIVRRATDMGLKMDREAVKLLADLAGPGPPRRSAAGFKPEESRSDMWTLAGELDKLAAYAAGQPLREEDVRALVSAARELEVWGLLDAIVEGKAAAALRLLRQLFVQGKNAAYLLTMIQRQFRNLAIAREMLDAGASDRSIGERLGAAGYGLEKLLERASRCPLSRVRAAFRRLLEADAAIKRGVYDEDLALELLVQDLASTLPSAA